MAVIAFTDDIGTASGAVATEVSRRLGVAHLVEDDADLRPGNHDQASASSLDPVPWCRRVDQRFDPWSGCQALRRGILQAAAGGDVVIRGTCAPIVLQDIDHVLRVHILAPRVKRIRATMRLLDLDDFAAAAQLVDIADQRAADLIEHHLEAKASGMELYHIALNADLLGVERCAELVEAASQCTALYPTARSSEKIARLLDAARSDSGANVRPVRMIGLDQALGTGRPSIGDAPSPILDYLLTQAEAALYGPLQQGHTSQNNNASSLKACWD